MSLYIDSVQYPLNEIQEITAEVYEEVENVEHHFHNNERWFGLAAIPNGEIHVADTDGMTPFRMDAGNDDWGAWVQIAGSSDTPVQAGKTKVDAHRIMVVDVERKKSVTRIQMGGGDSGAAALAAGTYTEIVVTPDNNGKQDPYAIMMPQFVVGTKGWARCWVSGQNTGFIDFFLGIHEYD